MKSERDGPHGRPTLNITVVDDTDSDAAVKAVAGTTAGELRARRTGADLDRVVRRHRAAAVVRRQRDTVQLLTLLGVVRPLVRTADVDIDYHALMLDRGVVERAAAGQLGAA